MRKRKFFSNSLSKSRRDNSSNGKGRILRFFDAFRSAPNKKRDFYFDSIQTTLSSGPIDEEFSLSIVESIAESIAETDNSNDDNTGSSLSVVHEDNKEEVVANKDEDRKDEKLDRLALRLEGFNSYVLIGLWVSTSCVGDLLTSEFRHQEGALPPSMRYVIVICGSCICLLGLYSTIVFATSILYGKTAVGLGKDQEYLMFMQNTGKQRGRAFQFLVRSIFAFTILVCLVAINHLDSSLEFLAIGMIALILGYLVYIGTKDVRAILSAAAPIFAQATTLDNNNNKTKSRKGTQRSKRGRDSRSADLRKTNDRLVRRRRKLQRK